METKVALLVIYNHRFDKNIPRVQDLYKDRFSHIYHVVPFYDGKIEGVNVIPVYESSYYFQGYISQAYQHLKGDGFSHFFIIADDLILNPIVNENNLWDAIGVSKKDCFIPSNPKIFQNLNYYWDSIYDAINYNVRQNGVEIEKILPSKEEALVRFSYHNIPVGKVSIKAFIPKDRLSFVRLIKNLHRVIFYRKPDYPLIGCYSDIFCVTADVMELFCKYCGAFAASNLFVEVAVPTAFVLAADSIKYNSDICLHDGALWDNDVHKLDEFHYSLDELFAHFPKDKLFIHPVKLSKWK